MLEIFLKNLFHTKLLILQVLLVLIHLLPPIDQPVVQVYRLINFGLDLSTVAHTKTGSKLV